MMSSQKVQGTFYFMQTCAVCPQVMMRDQDRINSEETARGINPWEKNILFK
jgi:hypothetical protein